MRTILLALILLSLGNLYAQRERVKGNRILSTEQLDIDGFHTIEIYENFDVSLDEGSDNQVKIETDSNIHEHINVEVIDSVLTVSSDKDLRRTKALHLDIFYASSLEKIILHSKATLKSLSPITTSTLKIEINDQTEVFLTADVNTMDCIVNGKSKATLHVTGQEVIYQVNENSEVNGIITADSLKVDLYQKGSVKLEGELKSLQVRVDSDTDFYGEKLSSDKVSLYAEGASDSYILANQEITIEAKDKAEIFLLGEPKVQINAFTNEAILYKKKLDFTPNKFRL